MSIKTYVEALEFVLDTELDARQELICFRPGARRAFGETDRDVPLPRIGRKAFSVALGAALQGAHPVLDLRQESAAAQLLADGIMEMPVGMAPVMTIIACAEDRERMLELPGVYVFEPKTPRQAAGFLRSALKMPKMTIVLADQALFAEEDDIPEERSFALLPLDPAEDAADIDEETAYEEAEAEGAQVIIPDEEAAYDEAEAEKVEVIVMEAAETDGAEAAGGAEETAEAEAEEETGCVEADEAEPSACGEEAPVKKEYAFPAMRQTVCDLSSVRSLCALLEMDEEMLIERCAGHVLPVFGGFELHCETNAPAGEAAFIPPEEESASLWLGGDRLTIAYDPDQMAHADAARLLREVKRVLETPQLLIYDREYDKE